MINSIKFLLIYNEIGRVYWFQGKHKEAQEWTDKAFGLAERLLDPDQLAQLLYYAGIRYHRQGSNQLAEEHWVRSLEISKETGNIVMQARLYQNLGFMSKTMGDYGLALERLGKGKSLAEQCDDISSLSWIHETLGETHYALGDWNRAIESFQQSLNLAEQAGLRKATSRVFSYLGDIYRRQGRWTEADECNQRALSAITASGTPQSLFVVNLSLGLINMDRKRYAEAKGFFEKCWSNASQGVGFASRMATVKAYMAELAVKTGSLDEASAYVKQAIKLAKEAGARRELAYATMIQGIITTKQGHLDKAQQLYDYTQQAFAELGDKYNLGRVHAELGKLYLQRDSDAQAREKAVENISIARAIFSELGAQNDLDILSKL